MEQREFVAKNCELAIEQGLKEMGLTKEQAEITIMEEKSGIFKKAKVLISKKKTDGEKAVYFVEQVLEKMKVKAACDLDEKEEEIAIEITTTEPIAVLGRGGDVIDSIQYLASMYVNRDNEDFTRIVLDCDNYREKRLAYLKSLANRLAEKADQTGKRVIMDAMNPYERRIIHAELQKNDKVKTESRGEEPKRYIVIFPKNRKFDNRNNNFNHGKRPFNPNFRGGRFDRKEGDGERREGSGGGERRNGGDRPYRDNRGESRPPRSKEITFGTFLGNINDKD